MTGRMTGTLANGRASAYFVARLRRRLFLGASQDK
jgi:hypothetical protein